MAKIEKDLLGRKVRKRRTALEILLEKNDKGTFSHRLSRLKYIVKIAPRGYNVFGSEESVFIQNEAVTAFINGEYIATILLTQAFIERRFQEFFFHWHMDKEAKMTLKRIVDYFRKSEQIDSFILDKIDDLRLKRNPFVHLKDFNHPHRLFWRSMSQQKHFVDVAEKDAKDAISLMYEISRLRVF